jgi:hypothetical protein
MVRAWAFEPGAGVFAGGAVGCGHGADGADGGAVFGWADLAG